MTTSTVSALPEAEARALETLYEAALAAQGALVATQSRMGIASGGQVQRLGPGAWVVTIEVPAAPEMPAAPVAPVAPEMAEEGQ